MENKNLKSLRDEIDEIDEQVVHLLNKRLRAAAEIGMIKSAKGVEPYDPAREEVVFQKICKLSDGSMPDDSLRAIYREVISSSIALEKELIIGYLGPQATYTHQAAVRNFGSAVEYKPLLDIPEVFQSVETGECDYGVVPIENSSEGAVNRSLDLLVESDLTIIAQVYLEVQHCLFANCSMSDLREVRSKDHALAQCGEWLRRNLPKVKLTPTSSTAEAVRECKGEKYTGAIAGKSSIINEVIKAGNSGCLILGICNGFQILTETGLLKGTLLRNRNLKFINSDVNIKVINNKTKFTSKYKSNQVLKINIAHNEGNYFTDKDHLNKLKNENLIAFQYCDINGNISDQFNPNGAIENIAGIYNSKKNILGMMPHPERMVDNLISNTDGINLFASIMN